MTPPSVGSAAIATTLFSPDAARRLIGEFSVSRLARNGVALENLVWLLPVTEVVLRSGRILANGFCAQSSNGALHVFRHANEEGFRISTIQVAEAQASLDANDPVRFSIVFTGSQQLHGVRINVNEAEKALGPWLVFWYGAIALQLSGAISTAGLLSIERVAPAKDTFAAENTILAQKVIGAFCGDVFRIWPSRVLPPLAPERKWREGTTLELRIMSDGLPQAIVFREQAMAGAAPVIERLAGMIEVAPKTGEPSQVEFSRFGLFSVQAADNAAPSEMLVENRGDALIVHRAGMQPLSCRTGFAMGEAAVLLAEDHRWLRVSLCATKAASLVAPLTLPTLDPNNVELHPVLLRDADRAEPVQIAIGLETVAIGTSEPAALTDIGRLTVETQSDGFSLLSVEIPAGGSLARESFVGPTGLVETLWQEWELRRTRLETERAKLAELYKRFSHAKRHNHLAAFFSDLALLNRQLNAEMPMATLIEELERKGPLKFSEDEQLRRLTIGKMVLLIAELPRIKQKFELLAAMYPYFWAQRETQWLKSVFGESRVASATLKESRRYVPLVRNHVRSIQANLQRSLGEIEASLRPLDALFAREEVQNCGWSKFRRWAPMAVRAAGLVATGVAIPAAGAVVAATTMTMFWSSIGTFIAGDLLGSVCGIFLKNSENDAQFQRAARSVFPWWQIFMRTLVVSIREASQFIDDENIRAMRRDKQLYEQLPPGEQESARARLSAELRKAIVDERRQSFTRMFDGTDLRLSQVIEDIERGTEAELNEFVAEFAYSHRLSPTSPNATPS